MQRERIEWCQFYWFDTDVQGLPRILLIGDSIVVGYGQLVAERLKGKAVVGFYATSKIVGDPAVYRELALALGDYPVDAVYFNNGLHGRDYDLDFYRNGLDQFTDYLRLSTQAKLFWRSSTPITVVKQPEQFDPQLNPMVIARNQAAAEIMAKYQIPVDDLYAVVAGKPEYSTGDGYHYNPTGREVQADHVAAYLIQVLGL